jgi:hypothetical protein
VHFSHCTCYFLDCIWLATHVSRLCVIFPHCLCYFPTYIWLATHISRLSVHFYHYLCIYCSILVVGSLILCILLTVCGVCAKYVRQTGKALVSLKLPLGASKHDCCSSKWLSCFIKYYLHLSLSLFLSFSLSLSLPSSLSLSL